MEEEEEEDEMLVDCFIKKIKFNRVACSARASLKRKINSVTAQGVNV